MEYFLTAAWCRFSIQLALLWIVIAMSGTACSQEPSANTKRGVQLDISLPITTRGSALAIDSLTGIAAGVSDQGGVSARITVVLHYRSDTDDGAATTFEDALRLARALARPEFRRLRIVSYVDGPIRGHAVLPIMASDALLVTSDAVISDAAVAEVGGVGDDTIVVAYESVAARRGVFPVEVAGALVGPAQELVLATKLDGKREFASGEKLQTLRREGGGWKEEVWSSPTQRLVLFSARLVSARIATQAVDSLDQAREVLDLAELKPMNDSLIGKDRIAGILEVSGAVSRDRVRRWELNLAKAGDAGELNTVVVKIDSAGGDLEASLRLAGTLASTTAPLTRSIGFVENQSRGDAVLIALACKPLHLHPDARLGGPGGQAIDTANIRPLAEAIEQIALDTGRPLPLIIGLLDPAAKVFRFTSSKTGQVRYGSESGFAGNDNLDRGDADRNDESEWQRGEAIDLQEGLTATAAIELGLAEGQAKSVDELAATLGLDQVPQPITDRGLVHFIEWIGGMKGVSIFLLMIGMVALSMEAGAPGVSIPGFVSLIAFSLYFWIQFLNGTAQWLEVLAFALGVFCIAIEVLVLPGTGVFGIGGLCLLVLGVVLTSQTFVIPRNTYQFEQMTRSLWLVVGGAGAIIVGFALLRLLLPNKTLFKHLALETPDLESLDRAERLADYEYLLGQTGIATTPLRPAGRARFGDDIIQVLSDGTPLNQGDKVKVIEVRGNRVVVASQD